MLDIMSGNHSDVLQPAELVRLPVVVYFGNFQTLPSPHAFRDATLFSLLYSVHYAHHAREQPLESTWNLE